jgi:hypothetical protein
VVLLAAASTRRAVRRAVRRATLRDPNIVYLAAAVSMASMK